MIKDSREIINLCQLRLMPNPNQYPKSKGLAKNGEKLFSIKQS